MFMKDHEYDVMRAVEDRHWWYAVLRQLVLNALTHRLPPRGYVLDAGCGTGGLLAFLRDNVRHLDITGIDASEHAVRQCHERGLNTVSHDSVHALPFADEEFDAVLSMDVLYHADVEENLALAEMSRVLRPGGVLLLNLPAFECLRGSHDAAVSGVRRYNLCHVRMTCKSKVSITMELLALKEPTAAGTGRFKLALLSAESWMEPLLSASAVAAT